MIVIIIIIIVLNPKITTAVNYVEFVSYSLGDSLVQLAKN